VNAGLASSILPLSDIASQLMDAFGEGRP